MPDPNPADPGRDPSELETALRRAAEAKPKAADIAADDAGATALVEEAEKKARVSRG